MGGKPRTAISEFCDERGIPDNLKNSFTAYLRTAYAEKFMMRSDSETVHMIVTKMTQEQVAKAWLDFVREFRRYLDPLP